MAQYGGRLLEGYAGAQRLQLPAAAQAQHHQAHGQQKLHAALHPAVATSRGRQLGAGGHGAQPPQRVHQPGQRNGQVPVVQSNLAGLPGNVVPNGVPLVAQPSSDKLKILPVNYIQQNARQVQQHQQPAQHQLPAPRRYGQQQREQHQRQVQPQQRGHIEAQPVPKRRRHCARCDAAKSSRVH